MGLLDKLFAKSRQEVPFEDMVATRVRDASTALFRDVVLDLERTKPEVTSRDQASRIAGTAINLMTGQHIPGAFEGRSKTELALAEKIAADLPRDGYIRARCGEFS